MKRIDSENSRSSLIRNAGDSLCWKILKISIFSLCPPLKGGLKAAAPAALHLSSTSDEYLSASPLSISLRSVHGWGGSAVTLEKQATHRNDCVIIAVIQSGPHTRVESGSGVPDQCWPDWRRMRRWPVGTRWPSSSCRGPRSVRLPRQHLSVCKGIHKGMRVCNALLILTCG